MRKFLDALYVIMGQLAMHGKMLVGYLLLANPWLSSYPTLISAINAVVANPTKEGVTVAIAQAVLALGAGHRFVKVLSEIFKAVKAQ